MIEKVEGIIVGERSYSDSSKIIDIYTKSHGKIGVLSKGCKKLKNQLHAGSTKFIHGFFYMYYKEDKLSTLIEIDIINSFPVIRKSMIKSSHVAYITELLNQVLKNETFDDLYDLYINVLLKIEENYSPEVLTNIFELKLLSYLGVAPIVDECTICSSKENIVTISANKGGFVCQNCLDERDKIYSNKTVKLLRMFNYLDIAKITKIEVKEEILNELNEFLNDYYDRYTGLYLMTKEFLKNLKKINT